MAQALRKPLSSEWFLFAQRIVESAGVLDEGVARTLVNAFSLVPRDRFLDESLHARMYEDVELPIGYGQLTTKPSTVARILALIGLRKGMRVLEIGSGSGYCSAVMAAAGVQVFGVENSGFLAQTARKVLDSLYYQNVLIRRGDGRRGWAEHGPFDAIISYAAFQRVEPELFDQLVKPGGRLVAPVGDQQAQNLVMWEAKREGLVSYPLESCGFVSAQ